MSDELDDKEPAANEVLKSSSKTGRRTYAKMGRELSADELKNPVVSKFLYDEVENLETQLASAESYRDKFYEIDKQCAVLKEKQKPAKIIEIVSSGSLAIGSILVGLGYDSASTSDSNWEIAGLGLLLILLSIIAKWKKNET